MADGKLTGNLNSLSGDMSTSSLTGKLGSNPLRVTWDDILNKPEVLGTGMDVEGKTFTPYTVDEENDCAYIYEQPVVAQEGAEIFNDYDNIAAGTWSTAQGYETQAIGNYSIANGWWTRADGQCAVATGLLTRASGHFSHAEGTRTQATINNAHAEGDMTIASGRQSHAEGVETVASGYCSHSEGMNTKATNYYSHAEGLGTIANGRNQTVMGKYNVADTTSLLIVGNGTKDTARKNALKLSTDGDLILSGDIIITDENGENISLLDIAKKLQKVLDKLGIDAQAIVGVGVLGQLLLSFVKSQII